MFQWVARREGWAGKSEDARNSFEVDYARVIHSASFRRLQGKTQILNLGDSDFYRTRMTHSLEVAQIGVGIVLHFEKALAGHAVAPLLPPPSLMQTICLVHDLGHPPFGHGGEIALNYCMRDHGGFEGNGQSLRILSRLESFSEAAGSNLTRRALLGVLKYPAAYGVVRNPARVPTKAATLSGMQLLDRPSCKPPKCHLDCEEEVVQWVLAPLSEADRRTFRLVKPGQDAADHRKPLYKSFDCSIMELADDISNGVHDMEDAIALKLVDARDFRDLVSAELCAPLLEWLVARYPAEFADGDAFDVFCDLLFARDGAVRKRQLSRMVNFLINAATVVEMPFTEPLLRYNAALPAAVAALLGGLKAFVYEKVIAKANVQHLEFKGQKMVVDVFEVIAHEPRRFLPAAVYGRLGGDDDLRGICDHVSGMTDQALMHLYERLASPRMGSVFDHL